MTLQLSCTDGPIALFNSYNPNISVLQKKSYSNGSLLGITDQMWKTLQKIQVMQFSLVMDLYPMPICFMYIVNMKGRDTDFKVNSKRL